MNFEVLMFWRKPQSGDRLGGVSDGDLATQSRRLERS